MKFELPISFEISCLSCKPQSAEVLIAGDEDICFICKSVVMQNYTSVLNTCFKRLNLGTDPKLLTETLTKNYTHDESNHLVLYCCGVAALQLFVKNNWTGPVIPESLSIWEMDERDARSFLAGGVFNISAQVKNSQYLILAKEIFRFLMEYSSLQTCCWWYLRSLNVNSQVILERSDTLFENVKVALEKSLALPFLTSHKSLAVQLNLEAGFSLLHFYQYKQANDCFQKTKEILNLSFGFTGALGVRTKFQQKAVAQLVMDVKRGESDFVSTITSECYNNLPKNLELNDDTLLERVKLVDGEEATQVNPEEACVILAACNAMQRTSPNNLLKEEETATMVDFLLSSQSGWCVYTEALRLRCNNEKSRSRTVERSLAQLEELVKLVTKKGESSSEESSRLALFYAVRPPPVWQLRKDLARVLVSLGCTSSALDIYKSLEMWEDVILCLIRAERVGEAVEVCAEQIENNPTPNILCLAGDLHQKSEFYLRAWKLSGERCARAMTSLGGFYASKHDYQQAVQCFHRSLKVLSLQVGTWFTLGCTYLAMEEYSNAADAFRRCVSLDWDNFEAWTNLSAAYVRSGRKKEAFKSLSEALKCNFDKWELWENYLAISTDVGKFDEAIQAYNRLLDLKKKYEDIPVMGVLVEAVCNDIVDADSRPSSWLRSKLIKLFGRVTATMMSNYQVWHLYAKLYAAHDPKQDEPAVLRDDRNKLSLPDRLAKSVDLHAKALRMGMQTSGWVKEDEAVERLVQISQDLAQVCGRDELIKSKQVLATVRLTINSLASKLKQRGNEVLDEATVSKFESLHSRVETICDQIKQMLLALD